MSFALRVLVLLAAVMPVFAATAFRPLWWQIAIAAVIGSAVGQVVVRATRGRRVAGWIVAIAAVIIVGVAGAWSFTRAARQDGSRHDRSAGPAFLAVRSTPGGNSSLTWDDVRAIKSEIPSVELAVPYLSKAVQLTSEEVNWNTRVVGTTPDYFDLMALHVAAGDRFGGSGSESASKVVVLGDTVVARLYGAGRNPVGETVRIKSMPFTIVGVLAHQGMSPQGQDLDDVALVPVGVYTSRIAPTLGFGGVVLVTARSPEDMANVEAELRSLLGERHRLAPGDEDFIIRTSKPE